MRNFVMSGCCLALAGLSLLGCKTREFNSTQTSSIFNSNKVSIGSITGSVIYVINQQGSAIRTKLMAAIAANGGTVAANYNFKSDDLEIVNTGSGEKELCPKAECTPSMGGSDEYIAVLKIKYPFKVGESKSGEVIKVVHEYTLNEKNEKTYNPELKLSLLGSANATAVYKSDRAYIKDSVIDVLTDQKSALRQEVIAYIGATCLSQNCLEENYGFGDIAQVATKYVFKRGDLEVIDMNSSEGEICVPQTATCKSVTGGFTEYGVFLKLRYGTKWDSGTMAFPLKVQKLYVKDASGEIMYKPEVRIMSLNQEAK